MNACAPGTHFNTFDAARRYRCVWCGTTHVPTPDTRPRCGACGGLGIKSMTWLGTPGGDLSRWCLDNCDDCAGTGLLPDVTSGSEAGA